MLAKIRLGSSWWQARTIESKLFDAGMSSIDFCRSRASRRFTVAPQAGCIFSAAKGAQASAYVLRSIS